MDIKINNEKSFKVVDTFPYCFITLFVSSFFFYLYLSIPDGDYLLYLFLFFMNEIPIYSVIVFSMFVIPLQIFLNRNPMKFNPFYLMSYIVCSFSAVFIIFTVLMNGLTKELLEMEGYYKLCLSSAIIYWFWDSIFLQKKDRV
ncbi:UPF0715 family protein [Metabacillus malikii]|uniref:Uncharacterized protein n=1 Tax=Metabacillus malikii TaxID=1504265 RepID=A0ABT9ZD63_9BACI|nr:UPF0715 family protein [Metabacillus malikii]MDQ0230202.1 hypothetical protein [Metabacillus malikii]